MVGDRSVGVEGTVSYEALLMDVCFLFFFLVSVSFVSALLFFKLFFMGMFVCCLFFVFSCFHFICECIRTWHHALEAPAFTLHHFAHAHLP